MSTLSSQLTLQISGVLPLLYGYCKTLIFGSYLILAIFAVKTKSAKIKIRQYEHSLSSQLTL